MDKRNLFKLKELVEQINRVALMQIIENELRAVQDTVHSNTSTLNQIAEFSIEAKDLLKQALEFEPN